MSNCFKIIMTSGKSYTGPNDAMRKRASTVMTNPSGFRTLMEENIFISKDPMNRVRMLVDVLPLSVAADKVRATSN